MILKDDKNWYAVYTKSRAEKKVDELFKEKGIESFLPLQKTLKQWSDRKKWVEEPLFRSYIFVNIDKKDYFNVLNTDGVVKFVSFRGEAAFIPAIQIEAVRYFLDPANQSPPEIKNFKKGDKVKVIHGALTGLIGNIDRMKNELKIRVEIDHIGQSLHIIVPSGYLELI